MVRLAAIFGDGMVLQRGKEILFFGEADDNIDIGINIIDYGVGDNFIISSNFKKVNKGRWEIALPACKSGGPYIVEIIYEKNDADSDEKETEGVITFSDVYIGEVWLAGGQSNMELELQNSLDGQNVVSDVEKDELANNIRFYYTPKVAYEGLELAKAEKESCWQSATSESVKCWSAVGYYFGREISKRLDCKVGIIGCNWGGTSASCWISRETLNGDSRLSGYIERYDKIVSNQDTKEYIKAYEEYLVFQKDFDEKVGNYYRTSPNPNWDEAQSLFGQNQYPGPMGPRNFTRPSGLYECMLQRIMPYSLCGFIYYQGEEDDNRPYGYEYLLKTLVTEWRKKWNSMDLPFINVMLPIFLNEGDVEEEAVVKDRLLKPWCNWPFIREAQYKLTKEIDNYYVAVVLETGEKYNIHPLDKKTVGERIGLQALAKVYGYDNIDNPDGPAFSKMLVRENQVYICFDNCEEIVVKEDDSFNLSVSDKSDVDFEIAGDDKIYYPASSVKVNNTKIENSDYQICVSSEKVMKPCYVRYFWKNYGKVKLFGANNIPVIPFRSDVNDGSKAIYSRQGEILD